MELGWRGSLDVGRTVEEKIRAPVIPDPGPDRNSSRFFLHEAQCQGFFYGSLVVS